MILGNPKILGQGRSCSPALGSEKILDNPGILGGGGGGGVLTHPGMGRYLGILRYLDMGGVAHPPQVGRKYLRVLGYLGEGREGGGGGGGGGGVAHPSYNHPGMGETLGKSGYMDISRRL